jgi:EAL domain-containing protein (putative c-di-GMP-specific phosphodiesterase class I)
MIENTLTFKQQRLFDWICIYPEKYNYSPTVREMMDWLEYLSPAPVQFLLVHLREKGFIDWNPGKARTISVINKLEIEISPAARSITIEQIALRTIDELKNTGFAIAVDNAEAKLIYFLNNLGDDDLSLDRLHESRRKTIMISGQEPRSIYEDRHLSKILNSHGELDLDREDRSIEPV